MLTFSIIPPRNYSSVDNIMRRANSVHSVNGEAGNGTYRYGSAALILSDIDKRGHSHRTSKLVPEKVQG